MKTTRQIVQNVTSQANCMTGESEMISELLKTVKSIKSVFNLLYFLKYWSGPLCITGADDSRVLLTAGFHERDAFYF